MHEEIITIPAKKSKVFELQAEIHTTAAEVKDIVLDCSTNGMTTQIKAQGSLRAQILPNFISVPLPMGPYTTMMACQVPKNFKDDAAAIAEVVAAPPAAPEAPAVDGAAAAVPPAGGGDATGAPQLDVAMPPANDGVPETPAADGAGAAPASPAVEGGDPAGAPAAPQLDVAMPPANEAVPAPPAPEEQPAPQQMEVPAQ